MCRLYRETLAGGTEDEGAHLQQRTRKELWKGNSLGLGGRVPEGFGGTDGAGAREGRAGDAPQLLLDFEC